MGERFLITGGAGFIGRHFVESVLQSDNLVVVLDALTYAADLGGLDLSKVIFVEGNIQDEILVRSLLSQYQIQKVVNIAAETHVDYSIKEPHKFLTTNIMGTANLLRCSLDHWPTIGEEFRYLQMSTDEVYGTLGDWGHFSENSPMDPRSPYAASKAAADHLVMAWFHTFGLPAIITRCSNNYGPGQDASKLIPKTILKALSHQAIPIYGKGLNVRDWIHVKDHCRGVLTALFKGKPGQTYCFGGGNEYRNYQVIDGICKILDEHFPHPGGISYKSFITFVEDRLGHDYRYGVNFAYAQEVLGFQPQHSFAQGLYDTICWYTQKEGGILHERNSIGGGRWHTPLPADQLHIQATSSHL